MRPQFKEWIFRTAYNLGGRDIDRELQFLNESEHLSQTKLQELQWDRLTSLINGAYENTVYYKKLFDSTKLKPSDIQSPADLHKIPATEKHVLRQYYSDFVNGNFHEQTKTYGSSGSTGEPVLLRQSTQALSSYTAAQLRGRSWHGITPGDPEGKVWGAPLSGLDKLILPFRNAILNRVQLAAFNVTSTAMLSVYRKMQQRKVKYLYGYSSSIYYFSRFLEAQNISGRELNLKVVITTSDMLPDDQKTFLESFWACPAIKEYGAGETGIIAFECEKRNLHVTQENVFLEIVDGEVIVTPLINIAMPLLRYRLNDVASLKQGTCECGRHLQLMESLQGRNSDIAILPDGRSLHSDVFCYINRKLMEHGQEVNYFQIIQDSRSDFRLIAVPGKSGTIKPFADGVQQLLGNVNIHTKEVDKIQRGPSGKIRYVISNYEPK